MFSLFNKLWNSSSVIFLSAVFLVIFDNKAFFKHVLQVYPIGGMNTLFVISLAVVLVAVTVILLTLLGFRRILKPLLMTVFIVSSLVAYFMDSYDIVVDTHMIQNVVETNINESADLFSFKLVGYLVLLGILPALFVYRIPLAHVRPKAALIEKAKTIGIALSVALVVILGLSKYYTSFFREHKPLRYYANPAYYLYSLGHYTQKAFAHTYTGLAVTAPDAVIHDNDGHRELIILVVGEAVRWDHFSLNGYSRETNPLLKQEDIVNFTQFTSCGTETAVSVPCMFSPFGREDYEKDKALHTENVLDVLKRAGVNVLWRENNSDSKGVADRVEFQDYKLPANNTICEGECRDEGMLVGLQDYIDAHPKGDIVIVLHQMGNHGPAYYKRYPKEYEKFTPVCRTNQLEQCSKEEITNAYDNALLYTDAFLSKVIALLKQNDEHFETAMFYLSDHGESLGENGLYLHGFPYTIAPEAQKHVPAVMWFGKSFAVDRDKLRQRANEPLNQNFLFHTMLGFVEVSTKAYKNEFDILHGVR